MEALLPPLVAAFLAEWGDKTQLLAAMLAMRFPSRNSVIFAIGLATLLNAALSAFAGSFLIGLIPFRALTLMTALALLLAGAGAMLPSKPPRFEGWGRGGVVVASLFAFGVLQFGDKTQFITACLAARSGAPWLTAIGSACGTLAADIPAVLLANRFSAVVPLAAVRLAAGAMLLTVGAFVAISILGLI